MWRLNMGNAPGRFCDGITRRHALTLGGTGLLGGLTLPRLLELEARAAGPKKATAPSCIMLFLEAGAQAMWGADFHRMPTPYGQMVEVMGLTAPAQRLLIIAAAFGLMVLLHLFLTRTVTGSTIVAMAQNREGAALVGIDATRVTLLVFAISGALAAIAATLYAPINLVYPSMGNLVITKAFVIIILGGMGSIPGAIVGGLIIGMAESFGGFYVSTDYKDIIAFALLVLILSIRPQGLFAGKAA